jgi:hypothetical protein
MRAIGPSNPLCKFPALDSDEYLLRCAEINNTGKLLRKANFPYYGWLTVIFALVLFGSLAYGIVYELDIVPEWNRGSIPGNVS